MADDPRIDDLLGQAGDGGEPGTPPDSPPDLASLEVDVAGRKMTVAALLKSYPEVEKTLRRTANENLELKQRLDRLGWAPEFDRLLAENPDIREQLESLVSEKGSRLPEGLDPVAQKVNELDSRLEALRFKDDLNNVERKHGVTLTDAQKDDILLYMRSAGIRDANAAFWALHGPQLVQEREEKTRKEIVESLERNRKAVPRVPKGSVATGKPDVTKMTREQFDAHVTKVIEDMFDASS